MRRRYLIAYDIGDPARLRKIAILMEGYGERLQYSVFLCDLSRMELTQWETSVRSMLRLSQDSIVVIDLGRPDAVIIREIGLPRRLPRAGPTIL